MAETYGPFASGAGAAFSVTYWQEFFGQLFTSGVWKSALVGGAAGGNLAVTAASGMNVSVATGVAFAYGYFYENTTALTKPIAAADPTLPRKDYVVIELSTTAPSVISKVLTGTPASSPNPPTLTQNNVTWDIPLAIVLVPAGSTSVSSGNITDSRVYSGVKTNPATMGPGSGLDADTLDSFNSSVFCQTAGQITRILAVTGAQPTNATGNNGDLIIWY